MNTDKYQQSDVDIQQKIMDELLNLPYPPHQVIELEAIRRNLTFRHYSDSQILHAIFELVDKDLFDLRQHNPSLEQLRNGHIIRRG